MDRNVGRQAFIRAAGIVACLLFVWVACFPTSVSLLTIWSSGNDKPYAHGPIVAGMCIWAIFRRRDALLAAGRGADGRLLPILAAACLAWLIALRANLEIGHQLMLPIISIVTLAAIWGLPVARLAMSPVLLLYLGIPVWDILVKPLQVIAVVASGALLQLVGVPHQISGTFVRIPTGTFEVEGGCAGLHFLIVAVTVALFYGEVNRERWQRRLLIVAIAAALSLVGNWTRIAIIIYAGHATAMRHELVTTGHYGFGWLVFAAFMGVLLVICRMLPATHATAKARHDADAPPRRASVHALDGVAQAACVVVAAPLWWLILENMPAPAQPPPPDMATPRGWSGPLAPTGGWRPVMQGADTTATASYTSDGRMVELFQASYAIQRQGKELVGYGNSLLGDRLAGPLEDVAASDAPAGVREWEAIDDAGMRWLVWSWYEIGRRRLTEEALVPLWYGVTTLFGPVQSRLVASRSPCSASCADARATLGAFWSEVAQVPTRPSPGGPVEADH